MKDQKLGFRTLSNVDYHLNMVVGQSNLTRQQDPLAIFELTIDETTDKKQVSSAVSTVSIRSFSIFF